MVVFKQRYFIFLVAIFSLFAIPVFADGEVDINKAGIEELSTLQGISSIRAEAIVRYREINGPFQSLEDLKNVPGIGKKTLEKNMPMILIGTTSDDAKENVQSQD